VELDNKGMTLDASKLLLEKFRMIAALASWSSARDVFENVIPALYAKRATRLVSSAQQQLVVGEVEKGYVVEDVENAFQPILASRMKMVVGPGGAKKRRLFQDTPFKDEMQCCDYDDTGDRSSPPPAPPAWRVLPL